MNSVTGTTSKTHIKIIVFIGFVGAADGPARRWMRLACCGSALIKRIRASNTIQTNGARPSRAGRAHKGQIIRGGLACLAYRPPHNMQKMLLGRYLRVVSARHNALNSSACNTWCKRKFHAVGYDLLHFDDMCSNTVFLFGRDV